MNSDSESDYETVVLATMRKLGTATANQVSRLTKRKYDTAKSYLEKLERKGFVYTKKEGCRTFYILMPTGNYERTKPDRSVLEVKNEGYGRPSFKVPIIRASNVNEIIPTKGFVCHPSVKGSSLGREFVRCHFNGEYQIGITSLGAMPSTDFVPDINLRVSWTKTGLTTNTSCIGHIRNLKGDQEEFAVRTVSNI